MFFLLSKLLGFLLSPFIWVIGLVIFGYFTKSKKRKRIEYILAASFLFVFSNGFLFNEIIKGWEENTKTAENIHKTYNFGVVLGGMVDFDEDNNEANFNVAVNRLFAAVKLYKTGKIEKIILSGGSGSIVNTEQKESLFLKDFLISIGISKDDILTDKESRNTHENALNIAKMLKTIGGSPSCLLITSSLHMKRAKACFAKVGIKTETFPTDKISTNRKFYPDILLIPSVNVIGSWYLLLHEIFGYWVYRFIGYI